MDCNLVLPYPLRRPISDTSLPAAGKLASDGDQIGNIAKVLACCGLSVLSWSPPSKGGFTLYV